MCLVLKIEIYTRVQPAKYSAQENSLGVITCCGIETSLQGFLAYVTPESVDPIARAIIKIRNQSAEDGDFNVITLITQDKKRT